MVLYLKKNAINQRNVPNGIQIYGYLDYQLPCYTLSLFTLHPSVVQFQINNYQI